MPLLKLDVHAIVVGMFAGAWRQRRVAWDMMTVPLILSIAIQLAAQFLFDARGLSAGALGARLVDTIPTTMFLLAWMRHLLLGPAAVTWIPGLAWSGRETRFLLQLMSLALVPAVLVMLPFLGSPAEISMLGRIIGVVALVLAIVALRLAYGLCASAVDLPWSPTLSWRYGKGCGFAIIVIMLVPVLIGAGVTIAALIATTGVMELLPADDGGQPGFARMLVLILVLGILSYGQTAVIGVALAMIFRSLTGFRPGTPLRGP